MQKTKDGGKIIAPLPLVVKCRQQKTLTLYKGTND